MGNIISSLFCSCYMVMEKKKKEFNPRGAAEKRI